MTGNNVSAQVNGFAFLTCNVTNNPHGTTITYQWKRVDVLPISAEHLTVGSLYLPYVGVSDAGVYICEVNVSDSTHNPYVIPQSGSVTVPLTVTSK